MSRRFNDEPINLIHRIPTPEQLSSARPSERSFSRALVETGAICLRAVKELFAQVTRLGRVADTTVGAKTASQGGLDEQTNESITGGLDHLDEELETSVVVRQQMQAVAAPYSEGEVNQPQSASVPDGVQPEEVAEIRAYLLSQQQDIARLSAQIQELKSLVVSQQQVLVYLGRELEASSVSSMTGGVTSAPAKRNRPVRQKSGMKDKAAAHDGPKLSLLDFEPRPASRSDL